MKKLKLFFALFAMLALGVGNAWGADVSVTWPTTTALSTTATNVDGDANVTIKVSEANNYTNPLRFYAGKTTTIKVAEGYQLKSVAYEASSTGNYVTYAKNATVSPAVTPSENGKIITWDLSGSNTKTFTFTPSTQTRCNGITITYTAAGGETPDPTPDPEPDPTPDPEEPETPGSQSTATLIVGENGGVTWTNSAKTAKATVGDVVFTALGSGSNDSKYYDSDKSWRFYTANTSGVKITTPEGSKIVSVIIKWKTGQPNTPTNWSKSGTTSPTTFTPNSGINTNEVSFTRNSSANFLAQEITVNYETSSSGGGTEEPVS